MRTMTKNLMAVMAMSAMALAQATPATQQKSKTPPASTTATKPAPVPAKTATPAKSTAAMAPAKTASKPASTPAKATAMPKPAAPKVAAKPMTKSPVQHSAVKPAAPAAAEQDQPKKAAVVPPGKRDPFVNPIQRQEEAASDKAVCTTGPRCLVIAQVVLKGVVKTPQGMIAMVENAAKKEYNLHEKDPVMNGFVLKITTDSIVFRENLTDFLGRPATREVVKRVTVPVV